MRKRGGWFSKDGTAHLTPWFAKQRQKRHAAFKAARLARKRNRKAAT